MNEDYNLATAWLRFLIENLQRYELKGIKANLSQYCIRKLLIPSHPFTIKRHRKRMNECHRSWVYDWSCWKTISPFIQRHGQISSWRGREGPSACTMTPRGIGSPDPEANEKQCQTDREAQMRRQSSRICVHFLMSRTEDWGVIAYQVK